jgi:Ca2+-dependent lipid-binding protein
VQKNTLNPVWQESITFNEVATTDTLIVQLWDHKKFTANVCLGEVPKPTIFCLP